MAEAILIVILQVAGNAALAYGIFARRYRGIHEQLGRIQKRSRK
jgi:hypothetical protein